MNENINVNRLFLGSQASLISPQTSIIDANSGLLGIDFDAYPDNAVSIADVGVIVKFSTEDIFGFCNTFFPNQLTDDFKPVYEGAQLKMCLCCPSFHGICSSFPSHIFCSMLHLRGDGGPLPLYIQALNTGEEGTIQSFIDMSALDKFEDIQYNTQIVKATGLTHPFGPRYGGGTPRGTHEASFSCYVVKTGGPPGGSPVVRYLNTQFLISNYQAGLPKPDTNKLYLLYGALYSADSTQNQVVLPIQELLLQGVPPGLGSQQAKAWHWAPANISVGSYYKTFYVSESPLFSSSYNNMAEVPEVIKRNFPRSWRG